MKILTADDSPAIRKLIRNILELAGHSLIEAEDGAQALVLLREHKDEIKLVLLDWNMPNLDGYETLQAIKNDQNLKHLPVIMITTEVSRNKVINAIKYGASNYIMKPFTDEELLQKVNDIFE